MKALSVRQPWTTSIVHLGKPVDNRTWSTAYRGEIALHASGRARWDFDGEYSPLVLDAWEKAGNVDLLRRDHPAIVFGAVIAVADLTDICTVQVEDLHCDCDCGEWAAWDQYHWWPANVRPLARPVPAKGALGLWTLPDEVEAAVRAQLCEAVSHG